MFIWFGKKGFMRGPAWFLFFVGCIALLIGDILMLYTSTEPDSWAAIIVFSVLAVLYIAAYILAPKISKSISEKIAPMATPMVNMALSIPATLKIIRDSSAAAALIPTIITINGVQVASLTNGGIAEIQTNTSHNILQTNSVGSKNVRYEFDVQSGAYGEIHVKGGVFLPKATVWKN